MPNWRQSPDTVIKRSPATLRSKITSATSHRAFFLPQKEIQDRIVYTQPQTLFYGSILAVSSRLPHFLVEKFPDGYADKDIIAFRNAQNEYIETVEVRTEDTVYLIKVGKRLTPHSMKR